MAITVETVNVETLAATLKTMLAHYGTVLGEDGVHNETKLLDLWLDSYRRGVVTNETISQTSAAWFADLHKRLKKAADTLCEIDCGSAAAEKMRDIMTGIDAIDRMFAK